MSKKIKIVFIISLTFNLILFLSIIGIGIKAWHFKEYSEKFFLAEDGLEELGDNRDDYAHRHYRSRKGRKSSWPGGWQVLANLRENEILRENFKDIRNLRKELIALAESNEPISMEAVTLLFNQIELKLTNSVEVTQNELMDRLAEMNDLERKETILLFLKFKRR